MANVGESLNTSQFCFMLRDDLDYFVGKKKKTHIMP